ncbi:heavy metal translocating P-type ATPase [Deinococcus altitudinis]|uniref:heavy metal translocating P-type ATPase n=1 Tax=Deinococcus altitudinis TaxID=468914 RepID=UPI0038929EEF
MTTSPSPLEYFVENMDCASCVQKVERMVGNLPGTAQVRTSFNRQTLKLTLDEAQTSRELLENNLRSMGYAPTALLETPAAAATPLEYFVESMDCATCVRKVEGMVGGLPGASDIRASFSRQTLQLTLDETQTPRGTLESNMKAMGYAPSPLVRPGLTADVQPALVRGKPWYASGQGRLVVGSGVLLALAFVFSFVEPRFSVYGYVAATLLGTLPLLKKAVASARFGDPFSINMLVSLAAVGAVLIGQAAEGAVVVFFFAVGELLEGVAAGKARAGIQALAALAPKTALLLEGKQTREVPADSLQVGNQVQVRPGARVPADGRVVRGTSSLDDSPVTGESVPVLKTVGDRVFAGSINTDGVLSVEVEKTATDNTIARIIHMVEEAESSKAPTARFIDRFSRVYTPGVVAVSTLVAVLPPLLMGGEWHTWLYKGIALLLIGCPCALVLSVPAAITSGVSAGARRGLLIKGGAALETLGSVRTVAFDKTGTLTAGKPSVTDVVGIGVERTEVLRLAAAVESGSNHPLARAITREAKGQKLSVPEATDAQAVPGKAVSAVVDGRVLSVASPRHAAGLATLDASLQQQIGTFESQGRTTVLLLDGTSVLGLIAMRDEARPDARAAIAELKAMGVRTVMLTGDNARTGQAIAAQLGMEVRAELLPEDKLRLIADLHAHGGVAMVGDGINDAPALAQSDVGIAMGGGTDVALETADAALLREQVSGVPELIGLSRATMSNIRLNIAFALGLKLIFLITTLLGYTNLWMAILADTGATAIVTANALRLLGWKPKRATAGASAPVAAPVHA